MNKDNVNAVLDALAARLSVPASHLWAVLVRQVYVNFWREAAEMVFALVFIGACVWLAGFCHRRAIDPDAGYDSGAWYFPAGTALIAAIACFFVEGSAFMYAVSALGNPEYSALRDVLGALR